MKSIKNISSFLIKSTAVIISMLYLIGPMYKEFNSLLHNISHTIHSFEYKNHSLENHTRIDKFADEKTSAIQKNDQSFTNYSKSGHRHKIVNLLYSLFDTSNSDDHQDSLPLKIKIDKHLVYLNFQKEDTMAELYPKTHWIKKEDLDNGYLDQPEFPPKQQYFFYTNG